MPYYNYICTCILLNCCYVSIANSCTCIVVSCLVCVLYVPLKIKCGCMVEMFQIIWLYWWELLTISVVLLRVGQCSVAKSRTFSVGG